MRNAASHVGRADRELTHDLTGTLTGPGALLRGFRMWRLRPGLMLLGAVPAFLVLLLLTGGAVAMFVWSDSLADWMTPFLGSDGVGDAIRLVVRIGLVAGYLVAAWTLFVALTLALGDPFYAKIWRETEEMLGGPVPRDEVGLWRSVLDSARLVALSALLAVGVAVLGFIPVIGTIVAAVLGFGIGGWLLAGELLARPLEARGLAAAQRKQLVRRRRGRVFGFGVSTQACFWIPGGAIVAMPAAVVGATLLARELLEADGAQPQAPNGRPDSV